ncbi:Nmad3 family putative nucleotide modification protein [Halorubrum vacuolatum]|uniref:Nucleotide modification associated domain-containing protein n=1 Tax=Halorubrum vacuolatum TaxID=63740 RepID=A0A238X2B7_HALVU|nr:hypothetical protein [Halorubrum vacuolatum]SNR52708.1 hypothetical protein SAMN06264855_11259 [Halorubrum vacuolatum]
MGGRPRAVAVNVAANTNEPGFRGPVYPDGSFAYVPIPEDAPTRPREGFPTDEPLPTYGDLDVPFSLPNTLLGTPIHADPEFPDVHGRERATYGDPFGVKAGPIATLGPGDWLLFYATLTLRPADWRGPGEETVSDAGADGRSGDWLAEEGVPVADALAPDWGAYLFAAMRIDRVLSEPTRDEAAEVAPTNAHLKRDPFDARMIVAGEREASGLFDRVVPLSTPGAGVEANRLVTERSSDSGKGPWWRRPLRFGSDATAELLDRMRLA